MKKLLTLAMCAAITLSISVSAAADVELKWYQPEPAGHPLTDVGQLICDEVEKTSGGRIKIIQYPAEQLGRQLEAIEMLRVGLLALLTSGPTVLNSFDERVQVFGIPYHLKTKEQACRCLDSPAGKELFNESVLRKSGVRTIQLWYFGAHADPEQIRHDAGGHGGSKSPLHGYADLR